MRTTIRPTSTNPVTVPLVSAVTHDVRYRRRKRFPVAPVCCALALALGGCGGGGGDADTGGSSGPVDVTTVTGGALVLPGGDVGGTASTVDEGQLRRNAFSRATAGINVNVGNLRRILPGGDDTADTGLGELANLGETGLPGIPGLTGEDGGEILGMVDGGAEAFFSRTLGIDDPNAVVTRDGDVITIDPDDATLCADDPFGQLGALGDEFEDDGFDNDGFGDDRFGESGFDFGEEFLDDGMADTDSLQMCLDLAAGLTTQIEALTEESGVITYLYEGESLLSTGYSPTGVVQELRLAGASLLLSRIETVSGAEPGSLSPATLNGTLRWEAEIANDTPGQEAGTLSVSVTETLEIADANSASSLTLEPSDVLRLAFDEATGAVSASVSWGALRLVTEDDDDFGNVTVTAVSLEGLTFDLSGVDDETTPAFSIANVGLGGAPLTVQVDGSDALTLSVENFGVTLDDVTGALNFDTALAVDLMIDNLGGLIEEQSRDYRANFSAAAPTGTSLLLRPDGLVQVDTGSLDVSVEASDGAGSTQSEISVDAGSCIGQSLDGQGGGTVDEDAARLTGNLVVAAFACP